MPEYKEKTIYRSQKCTDKNFNELVGFFKRKNNSSDCLFYFVNLVTSFPLKNGFNRKKKLYEEITNKIFFDNCYIQPLKNLRRPLEQINSNYFLFIVNTVISLKIELTISGILKKEIII
ncbi:hypothetical protein BpHYR1_015197 [Brachionus plicatilis]|uniref:Uncharacterized protein n=1 Tax=Brachionus plicatilis TaxID=10195 RepID=A0A3M7QKU1_BRAPC|nr:hypothetical protein BpHYR1_015197 [Brachionus plicatilis]